MRIKHSTAELVLCHTFLIDFCTLNFIVVEDIQYSVNNAIIDDC